MYTTCLDCNLASCSLLLKNNFEDWLSHKIHSQYRCNRRYFNFQFEVLHLLTSPQCQEYMLDIYLV